MGQINQKNRSKEFLLKYKLLIFYNKFFINPNRSFGILTYYKTFNLNISLCFVEL